MTETTGMRCWAFGPSGVRCEIPVAEHQMDDQTGEWIHSVSINWTDSECVHPDSPVIRQVGQTNTERPVPIFEMLIDDEPGELLEGGERGKCFICGCAEAAHGDGGCEEHDCKTYLE